MAIKNVLYLQWRCIATYSSGNEYVATSEFENNTDFSIGSHIFSAA
jgi:hypothetical protein